MQMQPLPQPSRCVHTPVAPGTRAGTRGDTSIHHPPSYPLTPYLLTSYLPTYSELNPNTAKNHPLRLSEQRPSRLLCGEWCPSHIGRWDGSRVERGETQSDEALHAEMTKRECKLCRVRMRRADMWRTRAGRSQ